MTDVDVLYVAGWGRSGSTILDTALGQVDGLVSVGEVKFLWERGLTMGSPCGCGSPLDECPFWSEVMDRAFGGRPSPAFIAEMDAASRGFRTRHLPLLLTPRLADRYVGRFDYYQRQLVNLYQAILETAGGRTVIDSSKYPPFLALLQRIPDMRVRTVHIVRDPRAVAYSWQRHKENPDIPQGGEMPRLHPAATGAYWTTWNAAVERIAREGAGYMRVRYEDLAAAPRATVRQVLEFAGYPDAESPFVDDRTITLGVSHTVSGNPIRFNTGTVVIRQDAAWEEGMSSSDRRWAQLTSAPLRGRYGY